MLHKPLLWSPDRLGQHVSTGLTTSLPLLNSHPRMSLQSALIGFLLSRVLSSSITPRENVVVQTTAVATGTMALAAGFVGIIPALGLLNVDQDGIPPIRLSWPASLAWSFAIAYYGFAPLPWSCVCISNRPSTSRILISPPIRKQVVSALFNTAFPKSTPIRSSKRNLPSPLGPPRLSLLPSSINSRHQPSQIRASGNIPPSPQPRDIMETMALSPVNRLIRHLYTFLRAGDR